MDAPWIETEIESAGESRYRLTTSAGRITTEFVAKAERWAPVALSSIVAKYAREVSMTVFNRYWRRHDPDLRPTAGYPVDARRFRRDVAAVRTRLGISDDEFWRRK